MCVSVWEEQGEFFPISLHNQEKMCSVHFCSALAFSPSRLLYNEKLHSDSDNWINTSINCNMQFEGSGGDWIMFCRIIILHLWSLFCHRGTKEFFKCVLTAERSFSLLHNDGTLALWLTHTLKSSETGAVCPWSVLQTFVCRMAWYFSFPHLSKFPESLTLDLFLWISSF